MPIPPLNKKNRPDQNWRRNKKRYYASGTKNFNRGSGGRNKKNGLFAKRALKIAFKTGLVLFLLFIFFAFGAMAWVSKGLPDPNKLIDREIAQSTKIYDRSGEHILYEISGEQRRTLINIADLPEYVLQATIAIEDKDFYRHKGFSLWGILRGVVWQSVRGKRVQGGSTLTQQFVKNAILTPERKITRKMKEWILAYRIEKKYSKDEILQMYFNEIPYGSTAYGVEAASKNYFGKSARDLTLAEAAILAALPQAPSKYSPYGSNKNLLIERQHYVLDMMTNQKYITEEQAGAAKMESLEFKQQITNIVAPHFVMQIKEMLSEKYGEKTIEQGGLKIYTTLDLYKQKIAEEAVAEFAPKNEEKYGATNASLVSIDPKTGQVLALVGSKNFFSKEIDGQVNIATSNRQPGSSLKPMVYTAAFLKGYTPNTILYDVVTNFSASGKPYEPRNYDLQERGPVTMRQALAGSLNVPAVKAIYLAGIDNVLNLTQDLGYTTLNDRDRFGLSLVLGGGEVKLLEHTNAYAAFAREGLVHPISFILKIEDKNGKVMEEFKKEEKRALDPKIARMTNDILADNSARAYVFGERNYLTLGSRPVAAKTGTTNDYRDAWAMGFTPSLVAGVWVGNNDNSEMKRGADGSVVAAPIWHYYMNKVLGDTPIEYIKTADIPVTGKPVLDGDPGTETVYKIDKISGLLATEYTPPELIEEKTFFDPRSILYYVDKNDPLGDPPADPNSDPQFELWESRIIAWAEKQIEKATSTLTMKAPPTEKDNVHIPENIPKITIVSPKNNETITEENIVFQIKAEAPRGIKKVEYHINDHLLSVVYNPPFNLETNLNFLTNGFHNLKAKACDDVENCSTASQEFNLFLSGPPASDNIAITFTNLSNGAALANIDFPLAVELSINQPNLTALVNVYIKKETAEKYDLLASLQPIDKTALTFVWQEIPSTGTYQIYAEAESWSKQKTKTNSLLLNISNSKKSE